MQYPIVLDSPLRHVNQKHVLNLQVEPIPLVKVGIVGLGERGLRAVERLNCIEGASVIAICDVSTEKVEKIGRQYHIKHLFDGNEGYRQMCKEVDLDLVYICTDWQSHTPITLEALYSGHHVAVEVPAALSLKDIWAIVDAAEKTQRHCMMLENCVYDFFEQSTLQMVRNGLFGEIIHVEGGYAHEIANKWPHWRLEINKQLRGDIYPTHGMGPACQLLDIHRTDDLDYLVSMDSLSIRGKNTYQQYMGNDANDFQNGDQTTSIIRTRKGKTILLQHNVMTPRPYSRMYQIVGSRGFAEKYPQEQILLQQDEDIMNEGMHEPLSKDITSRLLREYEPEYITQLRPAGAKLDPRGGMAYFMDNRLIYCLNQGLPLDMDVYDLAEWCAVIELSHISILHGSAPVKFPDFIRK